MSETEGIRQLVTWAKLKGAQISENVGFGYLDAGYIGAIYNGEGEDSSIPSIKIPFDALVTIDKAIEYFGEWALTAHLKTSNVNAVLKMYLSRLRSERNHEFSDFVNLLPTSEQIGTPYCWNAEYKAYLKGTNLGNSLRDNIALLVEEWWQIVNMIPESVPKPENHYVNLKFYYEYKFYTDDDIYKYFAVDVEAANWTSFPNYLWASLILKSRSFPYYLFAKHVTRQVAPDEAVLIPVIDLTNHNPKAKVSWSVGDDGSFTLECENPTRVKGAEIFNNYGMKGNEELLLAYGFCIEDNSADSAALKIKVPVELLPELEAEGVKLPTMNDYTTAVHRSEDVQEKVNDSVDKYKKYEDGLLFFVTKTHIPDSLILLFQLLMKNKHESKLSLRMKLSGLNQLRQAIESKLTIIENVTLPKDVTKDFKLKNISTYIKSQKQIMLAAIKNIKRQEKTLLAEEKSRLISLKSVWKKDAPFQRSLLLALGVTSFDQLVEAQFLDQCWLLWLIRCYNRNEYDLKADDVFLPEWIHDYFVKVAAETEIQPAEVLQYKELYQGLIPELNQRVPDIYDAGKWRVNELIISAKVLDLISFTRGKEQECIIVEPEQ